MNPLNHVAIIMDGNGRWGLKNKKSRNEGHRAGLNTIENILKETIKQKIKFTEIYKYLFLIIKMKEFLKYKKLYPKKSNDILKLNNYVRLKILKKVYKNKNVSYSI